MCPSNGWVAQTPVLSVGNVSKARSVAGRRALTDSPRLALAGDAMMTTTTTTCLFPVEAAEGPPIRLPGLAQVLGQPSLRGTSKISAPPTSIPRISPVSTWTHPDLILISLCIWIMIYHLHLYDAWMFCALSSLKRLHVFTCIICMNHNCIRIVCHYHSQSWSKYRVNPWSEVGLRLPIRATLIATTTQGTTPSPFTSNYGRTTIYHRFRSPLPCRKNPSPDRRLARQREDSHLSGSGALPPMDWC